VTFDTLKLPDGKELAIETTVAPGTADVVHLCKGLSRVGFQHFIFNMRNDYDIKAIEAIGRDVIPEIRAF